MAKLFSSEDRKRIATAVRVNEQYLYQCLTGRREMGAAEARRIDRESGGEIRPWDVCQSTWHEIWPELIGAEGAPDTPTQATDQEVG